MWLVVEPRNIKKQALLSKETPVCQSLTQIVALPGFAVKTFSGTFTLKNCNILPQLKEIWLFLSSPPPVECLPCSQKDNVVLLIQVWKLYYFLKVRNKVFKGNSLELFLDRVFPYQKPDTPFLKDAIILE